MIVPDEVRKCVAFVGLQMADSTFHLAGSVFWIGEDANESGKSERVFAVTARHVIDKIRSTGVEHAWFRINKADGEAIWLRSDLSDWFVHPSDTSLDVAILAIGIEDDWDHLVLPYRLGVTNEIMTEHEIGLGDEVFVTGLFRHHHGSRRNIPIVRVGNIACLREEKIETREFGLIDGLLIEARSIGGLSGSPVFVNLGTSRMIDGEARVAHKAPIFFFLGLVHGHFDVSATEVDSDTDAEIGNLSVQQVNTGIAIVVPYHSIKEVIRAYESQSN